MTTTKSKITISVDRGVLQAARELMGTTNTSSVLEEALRRLVRQERNRRDAAAYQRTPQTADEIAWGRHPHGNDAISDDTDWAALYADLPDQ